MRVCVLGDFTHRKMIRYSHGERHGGLRYGSLNARESVFRSERVQ